jgi:hypothetical protein
MITTTPQQTGQLSRINGETMGFIPLSLSHT